MDEMFNPSCDIVSLDYKVNKIEATELELKKIYDAAFRGLKEESIAVVLGFLPATFASLKEFDPRIDLAINTGRAECESRLSGAVIRNALNGETKAAAFALTHMHGWKPAKPDSDANSDIRIIVENTLPIPKIDD